MDVDGKPVEEEIKPETTRTERKPSLDNPSLFAANAGKKKKRRLSPSEEVEDNDAKNKRGPAPPFKTRNELEKLNARQLVDLVVAHQAYWDEKAYNRLEKSRLKHVSTRDIEWEKYSVRHVAFKVVYLGWDFLGLAAQIDTANTIEGCLSDALKKVKLIKSYESCHWSRAGRTDKGVSALGQVISCHVRSNVNAGVGLVSVGSGVKDDADELDYVTMLNGCLPPEIRVLGWTPVPLEFDARFSAISRTYKYFFAKEELDIAAMQEALSYLVGEHDFRNFCKMDTENVEYFGRCVLSASLAPVAPTPVYDVLKTHQTGALDDPSSAHWNTMYEFTIMGSAFLWHQIRYMVAVIFMVGRGQERPTIVRDLLDLTKYPAKPVFTMASEIPLILYDVGYFGLQFEIELNAQRRLVEHFTEYWAERSIKAHMARLVLTSLDNSEVVLQQRQTRHAFENSNITQIIQSTPSSSTTTPSTSTGSPTINVPKLLSQQGANGNKQKTRREAKTLSWVFPDGPMPASIPWGLIKDQVQEAFHPRNFHQPLEERPLEGTFQAMMAVLLF